MSESIVFRYPLALVFAGVPIPGKYNPYIILVSREPVIVIEADMDEADTTSRVSIEGLELGWRFSLAVKSFVDTLASRLEKPLHVKLRYTIDGVAYPPASSIYAASTIAIIRTLLEYTDYTMTDEEVLQAATSIDEEAGVWLDYLDGLRHAIIKGGSIVYRYGEPPLDTSLNTTLALRLVGEEDIGEDLSSSIDEDLANIVTKLAGTATIKIVQELKNGVPFNEVFKLLTRMDNALYYMLYGASLPPPGCKWTPSLQRVYGVCSQEAEVGDLVEFML